MYGVAVTNAFSLLDDEDKEYPLPAVEQAPVVEVPVKAKVHRENHNRKGNDADAGKPQHGNRPPKREFDRRSGTGRDSQMKRNGQGAHNWGNAAADMAQDVEEVPAVSTSWDSAPVVPEVNSTWAVEPEASAPVVDAAPVVPEEPEIEQLDLAEYLKSQEALRVEEDNTLQIRQVERDDAENVLTANVHDDESDILSSFNDAKKKKAKKPVAKKTTLNIEEFAVPDRNRNNGGGRGGRGGRGGGRGGYQGNDRRQQHQQQPPRVQVNLDDKHAFPSLA